MTSLTFLHQSQPLPKSRGWQHVCMQIIVGTIPNGAEYTTVVHFNNLRCLTAKSPKHTRINRRPDRRASAPCFCSSFSNPNLFQEILLEKPGGVRHGPQRVMGKNITDVHYTLDTME